MVVVIIVTLTLRYELVHNGVIVGGEMHVHTVEIEPGIHQVTSNVLFVFFAQFALILAVVEVVVRGVDPLHVRLRGVVCGVVFECL